jgi:hypothetical protein
MRRALQVVVFLVLWGLITHGTHAGTGDEPHYLAVAHSIAFDGDVDLANNYGANEPLVGGGVLQPEAHVRPDANGIARPVHDVGMPLVFAPFVRLAVPLTNALTRIVPETAMRRARLNPPVLYRHVISLAMITLTAFLAGLMFDAFLALGASVPGALGASALLTLSPPLLIFSVLFFTELLSALVCFVVFYRICLGDIRGTLPWVWLGCLTGFLILLHARNLGLVIPLTALALHRLRVPQRRREALAFALGVAALATIRIGVNYWFWGTLISGPHARFGGWPGWWTLLAETMTRTIGLIGDQEYGLLIYGPVYALGLWGVTALMRTRRDVALSLFLTVGLYLALVICPLTNVHGWTGGWSPAARFLTPVTPLLGLLVLAGLRAVPRAIAIAAVSLQIAISAYAWQHPKILWNDGDGRAAFCDSIGDRVCRYLPSLARRQSLPRREVRGVGGADGDVVAVVELDLGRDPADFVVLEGPDRVVNRRHGEQAVEERQLLLARCDFCELARDDEVFGAAVAKVLGSRDARDEGGAVRRQAAAGGDELLDEERLVVADVVVGARDPVEDVGKTRQIPRLPGIEPGQCPLDLPHAVDRRRFGVLGETEPFQERHSASIGRTAPRLCPFRRRRSLSLTIQRLAARGSELAAARKGSPCTAGEPLEKHGGRMRA